MKQFWLGVAGTVLSAVILGTLNLAWESYHEILELRGDVDRLYAIVSEHMQETPK